MSAADFVHVNGPAFLYHSLFHLRMSDSSSVTLRCADRRSFRPVSSANQRTTRFSQLELEGSRPSGRRRSPYVPPQADSEPGGHAGIWFVPW
jgi:hypothetical protein